MGSNAIDTCDRKSSSGLKRLAGDIIEKTLTVKKSFKLRFSKDVVLLSQGDGDIVSDAKSRRMIDL